jgi:hypothetical protein
VEFDASLQVKKIRDVLRTIPAANFELLKYIVEFLGDVSESKATRMDARNLAVVFGPVLLRQSEEFILGNQTSNLIAETSTINNIIETVIVHRKEIFE